GVLSRANSSTIGAPCVLGSERASRPRRRTTFRQTLLAPDGLPGEDAVEAVPVDDQLPGSGAGSADVDHAGEAAERGRERDRDAAGDRDARLDPVPVERNPGE